MRQEVDSSNEMCQLRMVGWFDIATPGDKKEISLGRKLKKGITVRKYILYIEIGPSVVLRTRVSVAPSMRLAVQRYRIKLDAID
jgi:hypothetical protein